MSRLEILATGSDFYDYEELDTDCMVHKLTLAEKYDCYKTAISSVGSFLLDCLDEEIEYRLFEEFDSDCTSFFHADFLSELSAAGLIDEDICTMTRKAAILHGHLEKNTPKTARAVRVSKEWHEILLLCDRIREKLNKTEKVL